MASQNLKESYSSDSNYYLYNKSTDRISSYKHQEKDLFITVLNLNNINDGVNSMVRENAELNGFNTNSVLMLAH